MGVKNTREWLEEYNCSPLEFCSRMTSYFGDISDKELYAYLRNFGMYTSESKAESDLAVLIEEKVWRDIDRLFKTYKRKWKGVDIPIFIIPHRRQGFFSRGHHKSGLAFPDKLVLFLSPHMMKEDQEALFVHEYHHVCRLNAKKKRIDEYTVADSCILEGLAEYAVQSLMGEKYLAPWTRQYPANFLDKFWDAAYEQHLQVNRKNKLHDAIIYGKGYPSMIGYCMGYYLVDLYAEAHPFSIEESFRLSSERIIENYRQVREAKKG